MEWGGVGWRREEWGGGGRGMDKEWDLLTRDGSVWSRSTPWIVHFGHSQSWVQVLQDSTGVLGEKDVEHKQRRRGV